MYFSILDSVSHCRPLSLVFEVLEPCTIIPCVIFDAHHLLRLANHRFGGLIVRLSIVRWHQTK